MAVIATRPLDDEHVKPVRRPRNWNDERTKYGHVWATKFPPFVFGIRGNSCLVHKVKGVRLYWWRIAGMHLLVKMKRPTMIAECVCNQSFRLDPEIARTCRVPNPDAILCGRCHGEPAPFGERGHAKLAGVKMQDAKVKLGCVVQGY